MFCISLSEAPAFTSAGIVLILRRSLGGPELESSLATSAAVYRRLLTDLRGSAVTVEGEPDSAVRRHTMLGSLSCTVTARSWYGDSTLALSAYSTTFVCSTSRMTGRMVGDFCGPWVISFIFSWEWVL